MLFANPDFDLVLFITPTKNPIEEAQKTLHCRFPNIPEADFDESLVASMLGVDEFMDLRPYANELLPEVHRNLQCLGGKNLHPLAQSAFNHLAFVTRIMDCFVKACYALKDDLGLVQDFSVGSKDELAKSYYEFWLPAMTKVLSLISNVTDEDDDSRVDGTQLDSLYRAIETFATEATILLAGNLEEFYAYYDDNYSGQFDKELDDIKNHLVFDAMSAIHYIKMLGHAKNEGLLDFTLNPALSTKEDVESGSRKICDVMKNKCEIKIKPNKAKNLYAELMGFPSGYQQIRKRLYNEDKPYSLLSHPAKIMYEASEVFCRQTPPEPIVNNKTYSIYTCNFFEIKNWNEQFSILLRKGFSKASYSKYMPDRTDSRQDMYEWLCDSASCWQGCYEKELKDEVEGFMDESSRLMVMILATMTTENEVNV
jgi:hypothetical protein